MLGSFNLTPNARVQPHAARMSSLTLEAVLRDHPDLVAQLLRAVDNQEWAAWSSAGFSRGDSK